MAKIYRPFTNSFVWQFLLSKKKCLYRFSINYLIAAITQAIYYWNNLENCIILRVFAGYLFIFSYECENHLQVVAQHLSEKHIKKITFFIKAKK